MTAIASTQLLVLLLQLPLYFEPHCTPHEAALPRQWTCPALLGSMREKPLRSIARDGSSANSKKSMRNEESEDSKKKEVKVRAEGAEEKRKRLKKNYHLSTE